MIDASVLANVVGDDGRDGDQARQELVADEVVSAPDLVDVETVSVLRKRWIAGMLTDQRFATAIGDLNALSITRYPTLAMMWRAFELRANVTAYDAAYIALAEALDATLLTADAHLGAAPGIRCQIKLLTA